jgi:hypothetical protein
MKACGAGVHDFLEIAPLRIKPSTVSRWLMRTVSCSMARTRSNECGEEPTVNIDDPVRARRQEFAAQHLQVARKNTRSIRLAASSSNWFLSCLVLFSLV